MRYLLIVLLALCCKPAYAQTGYLYIEPYTSLVYDSNELHVGQRFSGYNKEEYNVDYTGEETGRRFFHISSEKNIMKDVSLETQDKSILAIANYMLRDTVGGKISSDKIVRHYNGFSYLSFTAKNKAMPTASVIIVGVRVNGGGLTKFMYNAEDANDVAKEIPIVERFINGIKMYTEDDIAKEEKQIQSSYTIRVDSIPFTKQAGYNPFSYKGTVGVNEKLNHRIWGAEIKVDVYSALQFAAAKNATTVEIGCMDKTTGKQDKKGVLIVLNSFGKKVELPFAFSYYNK